MQLWPALYLHRGTSLVCHKLSSDSWQILDQEMTGVLDHHRQCCALTQAYKEASGWMCVLPSLEWVVAEFCLLPTPSSSHSSLNTGQKCSGGGRGTLSAVCPAVWCGQDSQVELREGDVADTCPAAPCAQGPSWITRSCRQRRAQCLLLWEGAQGCCQGASLGLVQSWMVPGSGKSHHMLWR